MKQSYAEKLKDPRWQKKRLEIMKRDEFACRFCYDETKTLHVHHLQYAPNREPWDYPDVWLITLCEDCHKQESALRSDAIECLNELITIIVPCPVEEVNRLRHALSLLLQMHIPDVAISALEDVISDFSDSKTIIDRYFEKLASRRVERDSNAVPT